MCAAVGTPETERDYISNQPLSYPAAIAHAFMCQPGLHWDFRQAPRGLACGECCRAHELVGTAFSAVSAPLGARDWGCKHQGVETKALSRGSARHLGQPSIHICEGDPAVPGEGPPRVSRMYPAGACVGSWRPPKGNTVEAVWATLGSNRSRGTLGQARICQVCALIQTHGGNKASHVETL